MTPPGLISLVGIGILALLVVIIVGEAFFLKGGKLFAAFFGKEVPGPDWSARDTIQALVLIAVVLIVDVAIACLYSLYRDGRHGAGRN